MIALKLSKEGYGNPEEILKMRTDLVMMAVDYEKFLQDYERSFIELNKESK